MTIKLGSFLVLACTQFLISNAVFSSCYIDNTAKQAVREGLSIFRKANGQAYEGSVGELSQSQITYLALIYYGAAWGMNQIPSQEKEKHEKALEGAKSSLLKDGIPEDVVALVISNIDLYLKESGEMAGLGIKPLDYNTIDSTTPLSIPHAPSSTDILTFLRYGIWSTFINGRDLLFQNLHGRTFGFRPPVVTDLQSLVRAPSDSAIPNVDLSLITALQAQRPSYSTTGLFQGDSNGAMAHLIGLSGPKGLAYFAATDKVGGSCEVTAETIVLSTCAGLYQSLYPEQEDLSLLGGPFPQNSKWPGRWLQISDVPVIKFYKEKAVFELLSCPIFVTVYVGPKPDFTDDEQVRCACFRLVSMAALAGIKTLCIVIDRCVMPENKFLTIMSNVINDNLVKGRIDRVIIGWVGNSSSSKQKLG
ncbi:MAG: hypothetical protein LBJ92_03780 [Holosporales bacterium]|jgi:hypothetical protein|nr:hypothetical protein [Holosporales bacterium]